MEKLSIDDDFHCQPSTIPDGVTCRVFVPSKHRHVDLFWPGSSKRFRDSLHPNNCEITKQVLENALNSAGENLNFESFAETQVPRVNILDRDFD